MLLVLPERQANPLKKSHFNFSITAAKASGGADIHIAEIAASALSQRTPGNILKDIIW